MVLLSKKGRNVLFILMLVIVLFIQGCTSPEGCDTPTSYTVKDGMILLDKEGSIPCELCEEGELDSKIIVLESEYCGACRAAVPKIKEAADELNADVLFLDLSKEADSLKMNGFKVQPYYTPTMVVGCDVYVGGKSKEDYLKIISDFLG